MELNHPFYIYPNAIMSEYNEYDTYRNELHKLDKYLSDLIMFIESLINNINNTDPNFLLLINIGSTMEDAIHNSNTDLSNLFQYQQLFPAFIDEFIKNKKGKKIIQIITISPDRIFNPDYNLYEPLFTKYSEYDFVKKSINEYECIDKDLIIKVNIFNCPVPCIDNRMKVINHYNKMLDYLLKDNCTNLYNITTFKQSENDLIFINKFYEKIDKIFNFNNYNNINILVNSLVSFKNLYGFSENYNMFPIFLELSNKYNIIATEWNYKHGDEIFLTKIISTFKKNTINYENKLLLYINNSLDEFTDDIIDNNCNINNNNIICIISFDFTNIIIYNDKIKNKAKFRELQNSKS